MLLRGKFCFENEEIEKQFPKLYGKISWYVLHHLEENEKVDSLHFVRC